MQTNSEPPVMPAEANDSRTASDEAVVCKELLGAGDGYPHRYWRCECCDSLLVTLKQDDATRYDCPQCKMVKCKHGGKYAEVTLQEFCAAANIVVKAPNDQTEPTASERL